MGKQLLREMFSLSGQAASKGRCFHVGKHLLAPTPIASPSFALLLREVFSQGQAGGNCTQGRCSQLSSVISSVAPSLC